MGVTTIHHIELTFENCEVIKIPGKYIGEFCIDNIHTKIERVAIIGIE